VRHEARDLLHKDRVAVKSQAKIRRVPYDIASMANAIRAADGLPDHFATDIETGGAS
jgi:hypothetical protein